MKNKKTNSFQNSDFYDLKAHKLPIYTFASLQELMDNAMVSDGIYHICLKDDIYLDICLQGMDYLLSDKNNRKCLVNFSGAVSNRVGKKAPFFSGLGLAQSLELPLISFADPTLALDANIPISWYAGNESVPNLHEHIAYVLNAFVNRHNARLLLFGGSGGGFACLSIAALLSKDAIVFVWNPQTAIEDYALSFVQQYMQVAFSTSIQSMENLEKDTLVECMKFNGLNHNLRNIQLPAHIQLLYIQNLDDWHTQRHAAPYMEQYDLLPYGNGSFIDSAGRRIFFFGQWGERHAVPPYKMIRSVIQHMVETDSVILGGWMIDGGIENVFEKPEPVVYFKADTSKNIFSINAIKDKDQIKVSCILKEKYRSDCKIKYAFYLYIDGERVEHKPYSYDNETVFDVLNVYEGKTLSAAVFVKDRFNGMRKKRINIEESK